jgi:L-fuconolactonase
VKRVDAHVHLWDLEVRQQPWTDPFPVLRRSFTVAELETTLRAYGVDGAIVVQAGDTDAETRDLLALAAGHPAIAGVVGWVDLDREDVGAQLDRLRAAPGGSALVGLRHQVQSDPDPLWLRRPAVRAGLAAVGAAGLCFDFVITPGQLPLVTETVAAVPGVRWVLDHAGKPPISSGELDGWRADLAALAAHSSVAVKLSGLVTEADWDGWTPEDLAPVIEHTVAVFGPERVMAGSDWPVCLLAADYPAVQQTLTPLLASLDEAGRAAVLGGTAHAWYRSVAR